MEQHDQLSDAEFEHLFESCQLDPLLFSHEAHLRLAWIHIRKYGVEEACNNICRQIKVFDITHGKGDKFNKTVTIAAIKAVNHFYQKSSFESFQDFIAIFPKLKFQLKRMLDSHYGFDIFNSEKAKVEYLEPDLMPF